MLKKATHIICSVWLAILLLFGTTPKEFIHNFANHTDTIDARHSNGIVADIQHHHCSFIGFEILPFENNVQLPVVTFAPVHYPIHQATLPASFIPRAVNTYSLRGPPQA